MTIYSIRRAVTPGMPKDFVNGNDLDTVRDIAAGRTADLAPGCGADICSALVAGTWPLAREASARRALAGKIWDYVHGIVFDPSFDDALMTRMRRLDTPIDTLIPGIIAGEGLDPVRTIAVLTALGGTFVIRPSKGVSISLSINAGEPDDVPSFDHDIARPPIASALTLGPDFAMLDGTGIFVAPLPETVVNGIGGRPLREVVSHPAFDVIDLRIAEARTDRRGFGGDPRGSPASESPATCIVFAGSPATSLGALADRLTPPSNESVVHAALPGRTP